MFIHDKQTLNDGWNMQNDLPERTMMRQMSGILR